MSVTCTTPASVSPTGGLYAPFNVTVAMTASSHVSPVAPFHHPASGPRETLEWLLAIIACGILTVAASMRSRGLQVSTVVSLVLLVCAGCASSGIGNNSSPNPADVPGTYTLTLAGTSGSLSHNATVTLTVK